jgi:NADH-quinone oxidoreductase subunit E
MEGTGKMFELSVEGQAAVKKELQRYETKESAIIPALYIAQKENKGYVSEQVIHHLSHLMDISEAKITEVFSFYTMFNRKPVGKYHVQVCTTLSCSLNGARELVKHLCRELKTEVDKMTEDGRFTVSKVECLGSCGTAPMMQVNDKYYEDLTPESAMNILRGLK